MKKCSWLLLGFPFYLMGLSPGASAQGVSLDLNSQVIQGAAPSIVAVAP